jgi:hypothetical protein
LATVRAQARRVAPVWRQGAAAAIFRSSCGKNEKANPRVAPAATKVEAKGTSKKDAVLALIGRKNGATLAEIMEATGWQKHTVRGFISILGKAGTKIESSKDEAGLRTYKAA